MYGGLWLCFHLTEVLSCNFAWNLNLDFLSEDECEHILTVVKQDFRLRDAEKQRLRYTDASVKFPVFVHATLSSQEVFLGQYFFKSEYSCEGLHIFAWWATWIQLKTKTNKIWMM